MRLSDDDLRTPQMQIAINRIRGMVDLALEKIALHHQNSGQYPLPSDPRSIERALHNLFIKLPDRKQKKLIEKANDTLKLSATKRAQHYGELKTINLRSASAIVDQVKALPVPAAFKFTKAEVDYYLNKLNADQPTKTPQKKARQVAAQKISFIVDSLTCKKKTEVGKDEISIAGFAVDNLGTTINVEPIFVGKFKKDQTVALGDKGKLFTFDQNVGEFPRIFTANIFLVEADLIHNQKLALALILVFAAISLASLIAIGVLVIVASGGVAIPALVAAILTYTLFGSSGLAYSILPRVTDDVSAVTADSLDVLAALAPGVAFDRTLALNGLSSSLSGLFPGEYTATGRWIAE